MFLLDYAEVEKNGKKFRIATFLDYQARQHVVTKFLNPDVVVPVNKLVTAEDLGELETVDVITDLSGNVKSIT